VNTKRSAKTPSTPPAALLATVAGIFAALASPLRADGSGAPSPKRGPSASLLSRALAAPALAALLLLALPSAAAAFGLENLDVTITDAGGAPAMQAGSHPFAFVNRFDVETEDNPEAGQIPVGQLRRVSGELPPGFTGSPFATPRCLGVDFASTIKVNGIEQPNCSNSSVLGLVRVEATTDDGGSAIIDTPLFNLAPPPGVAAKLGFHPEFAAPVTIDVGVDETPPFKLTFAATNITQTARVLGTKVTLWGNPSDPAHDEERGTCALLLIRNGVTAGVDGSCPTSNPNRPFLTLPRSCTGPLPFSFDALSWTGDAFHGETLSHDGAEPPSPLGIGGCDKLAFAPVIAAQPTSKAATSPTGLDFNLDVADEGISSPTGLARSDIRKAVVTLPEGMSVNPSQAEGLAVCTEAQFAAEKAGSDFGAGCPAASKIGTTEVESPLLEGELLKGSLFVAKPYENPFGSLIALYMTVKDPKLGIDLNLAGRVQTDPQTGQITTTFDDLPQQPFSHFRLHFREGARSPLVTPPACGSYDVSAELTPYSGAPPITTTSAFQLLTGPDNGACPAAGLPPFHPGLDAGTLSNAAGAFSPFNVRLFRTDSEQEITHFSIKLPPGVAGRLAGIPFCSDAQIAAATARTGPHGGREELDSPSCPAASQVGRTLAGAGVGPSLAYAPGRLYLAGPYHGHPVSFVAITAGVVGPFDIGTVVVRLALDVNPETGEVFLDSTGSDPIPHIVNGIPVHLRDIRSYTDRPDFTFNPTSCEPTSTSSTVLGSGLDFASPADDNPLVVSTRFQAADCAALPFKPKLTLTLKGSHRRAGNPALHAHLAMRGFGEAGLAYAQVALPKTEFLDNAHIDTICTRVQFREGALEGEKCPAGSIIGTARALTPILEGPLEGPIYLRSNPERELPDIAASLNHAEIHVVAVGHTDSAPGGGLRNTFEVIPDAPISSVDINLFGGHKGLIENSEDICLHKGKATVKFTGHNGKRYDHKIAIKATGCTHKKHHKRHLNHRGQR
jgi:hypothetical protein